ncbi:hypothetical protein [Caulobacter sp. 17J65-9]|uniref:hypothetical protein n=1 Tax=Caulobacter sp. 17J65-9 TaxID=2709382 RepID=UPI0013CD0A25|nr:hypothetical protein [Caulobacter sp. 17J65-9]NEX94000.1 hypothetical protein [Caulobacter sp. 17J65-9]
MQESLSVTTGALEPQARQRTLPAQVIGEFYHSDTSAADQVRHFLALSGEDRARVVVDVGGGCGFFARGLAARTAHSVRVVDTDPASIDACGEAGVEATQGDALSPPIAGDEQVACLNLILHHLVGRTDSETRRLQREALAVWRPQAEAVFVNEYVYTSLAGDFSAWLIFQVTSSRVLSALAALVGRVVPTLRANTLGVGVRFRNHQGWLRLFEDAGYEVKRFEAGDPEGVFAARRLLLIRRIHRCSYWLEPRAA